MRSFYFKEMGQGGLKVCYLSSIRIFFLPFIGKQIVLVRDAVQIRNSLLLELLVDLLAWFVNAERR